MNYRKTLANLADRFWLVPFVFYAIWVLVEGFIWTYLSKDLIMSNANRKSYNVWYISGGRWTNHEQDPNEPLDLCYEEAQVICDHLNFMMQSSGHQSIDFEVRELTSSAPVVAVKSNGASCVRCKDFNNYAEPNMPDGTFKCFSCRGG